MAFSYSDKNFTVIGNLCFVHININSQKTMYDIPPAIADRILPGVLIFTYPYNDGSGTEIGKVGFAIISSNEIICSGAGDGYLSCYFPIDSNK